MRPANGPSEIFVPFSGTGALKAGFKAFTAAECGFCWAINWPADVEESQAKARPTTTIVVETKT